MNISDIKLAQVLDRFEQIEARMGATSDGAEIGGSGSHER